MLHHYLKLGRGVEAEPMPDGEAMYMNKQVPSVRDYIPVPSAS